MLKCTHHLALMHTLLKQLTCAPGFSILVFGALSLLASCSRETVVDKYTQDNILLIGNGSEPAGGLDIQKVSTVVASNILRATFEGLCGQDPENDGIHTPGAAASWESNKDFTKWTFRLQPEGKWSDGKAVTTEDFTFAYNRILNPNFPASYASMLYSIKGAERYNKNFRGKILLSDQLTKEELETVNFRGDSSLNKDSYSSRLYNNLSSEEKFQFMQAKGLDALSKDELEMLVQSPENISWPDDLSPEKRDLILTTLLKHADQDLWNLAKVGVHAEDSHTLTFHLRSPVPYVPDLTKHFTWYPVPKHIVLEHGTITDANNPWSEAGNMVGNGPFTMTSWKMNQHIETIKNQHYWDAQTVQLEGVKFIPVKNTSTEARMFYNNQLHITYALAPEKIEYSEENFGDNVRKETSLGTNLLRFNVTHPQLSNVHLRRALAYAIDTDLFIKSKLKGGQVIASGVVPAMGEYKPAGVLGYDAEKAKAEFEQSNFSPSEIDIVLLTTDSPAHKDQAEVFQEMWKKELGINVRIEQRESKTYYTRMKALEYGVVTGGWIGDYPDPTTFLDMWKTGDGSNRTGWGSKAYEAILKQAEVETDPTQRIRTLEKAEKLMLQEMPFAPVYHYNKNYLIHKDVENWNPLILGNQPYKNVSLKQK